MGNVTDYFDLDEWKRYIAEGLSEREIVDRMGYLDIGQFRVDLALARGRQSKSEISDNSDNLT